MSDEKLKVCVKCGRSKSHTEFHKDKYKSSGFKSSCKVCIKKSRTIAVEKNIERGITLEGRICRVCEEYKKASDFRKSFEYTGGLKSVCKCCCKKAESDFRASRTSTQKDKHIKATKDWYYKNTEHVNEYRANYFKVNKDNIKAKSKLWEKANPDKVKSYYKTYRQRNGDKIRARGRELYLENREVLREKSREYYANNSAKIKKYKKRMYAKNKESYRKRLRVWESKRYKTDPIFKLKKLLRNSVHNVIIGKYKSAPTLKLLGCTIKGFKEYFESKFTEGMAWSKFLRGEIHIDHITPCASFDLTKPEQQQICFHYTNLQPLWARDNMSKGAKLDWQKESYGS